MEQNYSPEEQSKELAYDLRQIYAKIVGEHMLAISESRKQGEFYNWFKDIEDLHTVARMKFKDPEEDEAGYKIIKEKIIKLANNNKDAWLNKNSHSEERAELEQKLRDLEEYLYLKMNEGAMFGNKFNYDSEEY